MWHTFVLFTPAYIDFCVRHFGIYIHHQPTSEREKRMIRDAGEGECTRNLEKMVVQERRMALYVLGKLGIDVARRWYLPGRAKNSPKSDEESR